MFHKILLPLDGSRFSEGIIPCVAQLVNGLNAHRVTVLYVAPPPGAGVRTAPTVTRVPEGAVVSAKA